MYRSQILRRIFFMPRNLSVLVLITLLLLSTACSDQGGTDQTTPTVKPVNTSPTPVASSTNTNPTQVASLSSAIPTATGSTLDLTPSATAGANLPPTTTSIPKGTPATNSTKTTATPWWQPTTDQPIHWHWQLSDSFVFPRDVKPSVTVYDIDGELNTADTVAKLHSLGPDVKVICYFDAGVFETYRSDAGRFPKSVIGSADEGWDNSYWLDIRQLDILLPIMKDRMQKWCKDKGFDAIEPDETEVWSNDPGFPITREENNLYNQKIAEAAHSLGLSVGLKGNTSEAPDLWSYFDWSLNEQCWEFDECELLKTSFLDHGKAVFNIEYNVNPDCKRANSWQMNSARRDLNLVGPTNSRYRYSPCIPDTKNSW